MLKLGSSLNVAMPILLSACASIRCNSTLRAAPTTGASSIY